MKIAGIIGGIAPESTIEYYRRIIALYRERAGDGSYPSIIINSIDLTRIIGLVTANQLDALADHLTSEVQRLADAGAAFGLFASNTPHLVFDQVRTRSRIPLISIVEAARRAAQALGVRRAGLFGTRFTMQARFYPEVFSAAGIEVIVPHDDEQLWIHDKYMNELLNATIVEETRLELLAIAQRMRDRDHIDALILGGTELPLILHDSGNTGLPLLDTTRIHAEAVVAEMLR